MLKAAYLGLRRDIERVIEALRERLSRIEADSKMPESQDDATVAAVERMLAGKYSETTDPEDDFAGGTTGLDDSPWVITWRSHLEELLSRLFEDDYGKNASHLRRLADVKSQKKPFTTTDELEVIESILEYLSAFKSGFELDEADNAIVDSISSFTDVDVSEQPCCVSGGDAMPVTNDAGESGEKPNELKGVGLIDVASFVINKGWEHTIKQSSRLAKNWADKEKWRPETIGESIDYKGRPIFNVSDAIKYFERFTPLDHAERREIREFLNGVAKPPRTNPSETFGKRRKG